MRELLLIYLGVSMIGLILGMLIQSVFDDSKRKDNDKELIHDRLSDIDEQLDKQLASINELISVTDSLESMIHDIQTSNTPKK